MRCRTGWSESSQVKSGRDEAMRCEVTQCGGVCLRSEQPRTREVQEAQEVRYLQLVRSLAGQPCERPRRNAAHMVALLEGVSTACAGCLGT